jgi:putative ABC transport system permease protein
MRALARAPAFSALVIVVLGTGIGATGVMYTLVQTVLLRALPFEDPERLVWMYNARTERDRAPLSYPDFEDYRREASTLTGLALFTNWTTNLTGAGSPERLDGTRVSGNFFELLGTKPLAGRLLESEDEEHESHVTVLSYGLWRRRFGGDPAIIGSNITLNGGGYTVVGILPPRFLFPFREAELAVPIAVRADPRRSDRGANFLRVVARLKPEVTVDRAKTDLDSIAHRLQTTYPDDDARKTGISLYPLHSEIVRDYKVILWTLFGSVGVLLLASCVNIANLLLVRAVGRQTEFAIRRSLGASRTRIAGQLLGESMALAAAGGGLGLAFATAGLAAWRALGPPDFPQMNEISLDRQAIVFVIAIAGLTALACGLAPAWFASPSSADVPRRAGRRRDGAARGHVPDDPRTRPAAGSLARLPARRGSVATALASSGGLRESGSVDTLCRGTARAPRLDSRRRVGGSDFFVALERSALHGGRRFPRSSCAAP